ncbi:MAG: HEAT repeat domain-containing protein [Pyrinomonadaceae bacterium]|nr:HEAT repeat domain-containing protein [Pyrinomonadaceae bacterium]
MKNFKGEKVRPFFKTRNLTFSLFLLLILFTFPASAQDLEQLSTQIRFGTIEVKRETLFQIRNYQRAETSRVAVPALKDSNETVRATAAFSVVYLPKEEAFGALLPNLADRSEMVRRETAYALGKVQNPKAVFPLIQLLQKDKILEVRNAVIVALGEIGDASAIETLTKIFAQKPSDYNEFTRRSAAHSIGQIAQIIQIQSSYTVTPENFLPEKYKTFSLERYENLSEKLPQFRTAVQVLIKILQNKNESDDTKRETAFALGAIGDSSAVQILRQNLNSKDVYLAEICKEALTKFSNKLPE